MATVICAVNTARVVSSDITAVAGTPVTLFLSSSSDETLSPDARATIEIKSTAGQYFALPLGELNVANSVKVIDGPCTFRVIKHMSTAACGVEQG